MSFAHSAEVVALERKIDALTAENTMLRALLARYRKETPPGHQPHMIAGEVDETLNESKGGEK